MADTMNTLSDPLNTDNHGLSSQHSSPTQLTLDPAHGSTFTFTVNPSSSPNGDAVKDKWAHTRMKRKRTSPQDFAVLELEYEKNTRPDKKMRVVLSERVSMSEKEIQIWFQNRRQVTRRKGRTWQPNEISSLIRDANDDSETQNATHRASSVGRDERPITSSPNGGLSSGSNSQNTDHSDSIEDEQNSTLAYQHDIEPPKHDEVDEIPAKKDEQTENVHGSNSVEQIADALEKEAQQTKKPVDDAAPMTRLSMGADGTAKLVVGLGTPSPPSKRTRPLGWASRSNVLRRTQSLFFDPKTPVPAQAPLTPQPGMNAFSKALPSAAIGRSADTKAWEQCCDHEKQSPLEKNESAAASFRTLKNRSSLTSLSSRPPLSPALNGLSRHNIIQKHSSPHIDKATTKTSSPLLTVSRPKLTRTMSSLARIENSSDRSLSKGLGIVGSGKSKEDIEIWEEEHGDSDKENRGPDGSLIRINHSARPFNAAITKKVLGASVHGSTNGLKSRQQRPARSALVRSATTSALASARPATGSGQPEADMDAIQNLLSLSQGAWK